MSSSSRNDYNDWQLLNLILYGKKVLLAQWKTFASINIRTVSVNFSWALTCLIESWNVSESCENNFFTLLYFSLSLVFLVFSCECVIREYMRESYGEARTQLCSYSRVMSRSWWSLWGNRATHFYSWGLIKAKHYLQNRHLRLIDFFHFYGFSSISTFHYKFRIFMFVSLLLLVNKFLNFTTSYH
jgi:hypothetical protein